MPNALIPRTTVHDWSERIGENPAEHQASMTRLLKEQRRLTRWLQENAESVKPGTVGVAVYLLGVVCRMYDLAGGHVRASTWAQVRDTEARVGEKLAACLPLDKGFAARAREVTDRKQAHILDEALYALFDQEPAAEETVLEPAECAKVYFLLWVCNEVLDENWAPAKGYTGEAKYEYLHIAPNKRKGPQKLDVTLPEGTDAQVPGPPPRP